MADTHKELVLVPRRDFLMLLEEVRELIKSVDEIVATRHGVDPKKHRELSDLLKAVTGNRLNINMVKLHLEDLLK